MLQVVVASEVQDVYAAVNDDDVEKDVVEGHVDDEYLRMACRLYRRPPRVSFFLCVAAIHRFSSSIRLFTSQA